ncbi:MAG TPA: type 4a pilus biogenesis protein PilO [Verrucomicrobiae bacterium]|nr:type 4a pilus biogenesis protein PilO [Verrucomicrobiae bacterium]
MPSLTAPSTKRLLIDKANTRIVLYVSIAAFVVVFSLVATKTLISQAAYQNRVISAKRKTVNQLKVDIAATSQLKASYNAFISTPQNVIGGNPNGTGSQDGNNAKIVLDALPSTYDFPGLMSSMQSLLTSQNGVQVDSLGGTDAEATEGNNQSSSVPQPVAMPFTASVSGSYSALQGVVSALGHSIRPIQIQTLNLNGTDSNMTMTITAQTFYQPAKSLNFSQESVK